MSTYGAPSPRLQWAMAFSRSRQACPDRAQISTCVWAVRPLTIVFRTLTNFQSPPCGLQALLAQESSASVAEDRAMPKRRLLKRPASVADTHGSGPLVSCASASTDSVCDDLVADEFELFGGPMVELDELVDFEGFDAALYAELDDALGLGGIPSTSHRSRASASGRATTIKRVSLASSRSTRASLASAPSKTTRASSASKPSKTKNTKNWVFY